MPMVWQTDFGTNSDGSRNYEFCRFCFQDGKYLDPELTVDRMIGMSTEAMQRMKLSEELIEQAKMVIPTLKRWKD
jgi:hypothetical protein